MEKGNEKNMHIIYRRRNRDSIIRKIQNFFCKVENRTILRKKNGKRAESRIRKLDSKKEGVKTFAFASLITKKWWSYWFIYFFLITNLSSSFFPYWLNFSCLQITFVLQVHLNGLVEKGRNAFCGGKDPRILLVSIWVLWTDFADSDNFSCLQITFVLQVHLNGLVAKMIGLSTLGSSTTRFDFLGFRRIVSAAFTDWDNFSCLQITFVLQVHLNGLVVDIICFSTLGSSTTFFDFLDFRRIFFSEMGHKNIVYKNIFKDTRMSILYFLGLWSHHPLSRQVNKW